MNIWLPARSVSSAFAPSSGKAAGSERWTGGECAAPNPFYADYLLKPALRELTEGHDIHILRAHDASGREIARIPAIALRKHGRFPVAHCANWMHRHCFYGGPLLAQGQEEAGWAGLLAQFDAAPWSGSFLHLRCFDLHDAAGEALARVCAQQGRQFDIIETYERALLQSDLDAESYWTATVRAKKRKELRRLQNRLEEEGTITRRAFGPGDDIDTWIGDFLTIEGSGWKGTEGTALGSQQEDARFFRAACRNALAAGALEMLRIDCDGRAIAMLVNFVNARGGFSFKIAIDPAFARYSPGVLIEQDNLARILDGKIAPWMDSCAAADHPMIDSLWAERRTIAQSRIALRKRGTAGLTSRMVVPAMTLIEKGYARMKKTPA